MATYAYIGKTRQGVLKKGELIAKTRDEAVEQLRRQQVTGTSLKEKSSKDSIWNVSFGSGVGDKDIVVFTRQFATMINAGLPLIQCLEVLSSQSENRVLGKTIGEIRFDVEAGATFA